MHSLCRGLIQTQFPVPNQITLSLDTPESGEAKDGMTSTFDGTECNEISLSGLTGRHVDRDELKIARRRIHTEQQDRAKLERGRHTLPGTIRERDCVLPKVAALEDKPFTDGDAGAYTLLYRETSL